MNLSESYKKRLKNLAGLLNEDFSSPEPIEISEQQAEDLFYKDIFIYIQDSPGPLSVHHNLTMFKKSVKDGSSNIYMYGQTPGEYGFQNILSWYRQRTDFPLKFYTLNSTEPLIVLPD